jgi:hypothetical protein
MRFESRYRQERPDETVWLYDAGDFLLAVQSASDSGRAAILLQIYDGDGPRKPLLFGEYCKHDSVRSHRRSSIRFESPRHLGGSAGERPIVRRFSTGWIGGKPDPSTGPGGHCATTGRIRSGPTPGGTGAAATATEHPG